MDTVQLIKFLHLNCMSPDIIGLDVGAFWELVARMLISTDVPVGYSFKTGPIYGIPTVGVRVSNSTAMGLGLASTRDLPDGTALPSIWGEVYPLSTDDLALVLLIDGASRRSLVLGDGSSVHHLLLGPLALANGACDTHATAVPDLDDKLRVRDSWSGLSTTDYKSAYLRRPAPRGCPISLAYGVRYGDSDGSQDPDPVVCNECPYLLDNISAQAERCWLRLHSSPWFYAALGDDWVALNILAPMALMAPEEVVTHTVGAVRTQLLDGVVDWNELLHFLRMTDGTAPKRADALRLTYGVCIDALGLNDEVVDKVWAHVVRFIDSIDLPSPRRARRGSLRPLQSPEHGLGWTFSKDIIGECTVRGLWGIHFALSTAAVDAITPIDNLTSRSLVRCRSSYNKRCLFGPLARVRHACERHANLIPDGQPGGEGAALDLATGLTDSDYTGGHTTESVPLGVELTFAFSQEAAQDGIREGAEDDDHMPRCGTCALSPDLPAVAACADSRPFIPGILAPAQILTAPLGPRRCRRPSSRVGTSSNALWCGDTLSPSRCKAHRLFRFFTANVRLSCRVRDMHATDVLRAMYCYDLSVGGITETAARRGDLQVTDQGIAELGITANGVPIKYNSLWNFATNGDPHGGVSIFWDARIPFDGASVYRGKSGRCAAITLMGPHSRHIRVIVVYAPASDKAGIYAKKTLRREVESQITFCRRNQLKVLCMGDWNDVPDDDLRFSDYNRHYSTGHNLLDRLGEELVDVFRARHPDTHGHTFVRNDCVPSRLDSLWMSRSFTRAIQGPGGCASVDQGMVAVSCSDHYMVTGGVSFHQVFDASNKAVRRLDRRVTMESLRHDHLEGEALSTFNSGILEDPIFQALEAEVLALTPCNCPALDGEAPLVHPQDQGSLLATGDVDEGSEPALPTSPTGYTGPSVVTHGPGPGPAVACRCACSAAPAGQGAAKGALTDLLGRWNETILSRLKERKLQPAKQNTRHMQKASTTPLDDLRISAQRIKASLRAGTPNSAGCLVSAKADIMQLLVDLESSDIAVPSALTPSQDEMDATRWAAQAFVACNSVISQCRQAKARDHFGKIKGHVKSRFADYLRSLDGTGKLSAFLGRAGHDGSMRVTHLQARTAQGASTNPEDIHKELQETFRDWFAARKDGPGFQNAERARLLEQETYVGRGKAKSVAHRVTLAELLGSLKAAPTNSCPGPSGIPIGLIQKLPLRMIQVLLGIHNLMLEWGALPEQFDLAYIYPIPKKGAYSVSNSRPISLMEVHVKLLTRVINRRLMHQLADEDYFSDIQFGFRPGKSCPGAFHSLLGAIEDSVEFKKSIHCCLVDLTKAFDSLSPESLQQAY